MENVTYVCPCKLARLIILSSAWFRSINAHEAWPCNTQKAPNLAIQTIGTHTFNTILDLGKRQLYES